MKFLDPPRLQLQLLGCQPVVSHYTHCPTLVNECVTWSTFNMDISHVTQDLTYTNLPLIYFCVVSPVDAVVPYILYAATLFTWLQLHLTVCTI
jgi:hypothetical protein